MKEPSEQTDKTAKAMDILLHCMDLNKIDTATGMAAMSTIILSVFKNKCSKDEFKQYYLYLESLYDDESENNEDM